MFRSILSKLLFVLAHAYLLRYRPMIIGITGNVGKTSTKEAIAAVLRSSRRVRASSGNLNNEIGLPLSIVGDWSGEYYDRGPSILFWLKVFAGGILGLVADSSYPEILVIEYGADRPGDIKKLASQFHPHIAIVTAVGDVPVHVEYFNGPDGVASEKANLVKALSPKGYAVLNHEDSRVLHMQSSTKAQVWTYGLDQESRVYASNVELLFEDEKPSGVVFKLHHAARFVPVKMRGSLGRSQALSAAAAAVVGIILGINLIEISEALGRYSGPNGRLKILRGVKDSLIIDDTYNAAPASMRLALETLESIPSGRKIAVLGNMLELGNYSYEAHQAIGNLAGEVADILICVGDKGKVIADSAGNQMSKENIYTFENSVQAKAKVQELIQAGDIVLVKGSQGMRMERVVEEIMAHPENKKELLVRQSKKWQNT
ncbi:MAG: UDP-N-acetylmuramoyl-tripeptide--D-alanyl-D-alanine ligase [Patescibacteria group bacterium]